MQYLDLLGLQQLWSTAKNKFALKGTIANSGITDGYASVKTSDGSITDNGNYVLCAAATATDNKHTISFKRTPVDEVNGIASTAYVDKKVADKKVPVYTIKKSASDTYAAVYQLTKDGTNVGEAINIPKDMVVESGKVVWGTYDSAKNTFTPSDDKTTATAYVELTISNSTSSKVYIAVADLVNEHVAGDGITITNQADGTRKISINSTTNNKINGAVKLINWGGSDNIAVKYNNGTTDYAIVAGNGVTISKGSGIAEGFAAKIAISQATLADISNTKSESAKNKTDIADLTSRVDGIIAGGGEPNQNAYSHVKIGAVDVAATGKTDTITFAAGTNATVTGDASKKTVTFAHANPTGAKATTAGLYKIATDAQGHVTGTTAVAASDITNLIGGHSLTLSKTNADNDTAAITIGSTSYTIAPIPLGDAANPAKDTVRYILNN